MSSRFEPRYAEQQRKSAATNTLNMHESVIPTLGSAHAWPPHNL